MRAIFLAPPDIAVPSLVALHAIADIVAVICQPDRPAGRGLTLKAPAVKQKALSLGLPVHQPSKVRTRKFARWLTQLNADVAVVIAYGRILPPAVLLAPRRGCINLHASLLPKYRGAAPINWAIVHGETQTGITLMQMDEGCDTGPMLSQHAIDIGPDETAGELYQRLGVLAAKVVQEDLTRAVSGQLSARPQNHAAASHAPMLNKRDGLVDWSTSSAQVHNHIRGMTPWPGAHSTIDGKHFKLLSCRQGQSSGQLAPPGTIIALHQHSIEIACGAGSLLLLRGQVAGRKALDSRQLIAGRTLQENKRFTTAAKPTP